MFTIMLSLLKISVKMVDLAYCRDRSRNSEIVYSKGSRADVGADVGLVPGRRGCRRGLSGLGSMRSESDKDQ